MRMKIMITTAARQELKKYAPEGKIRYKIRSVAERIFGQGYKKGQNFSKGLTAEKMSKSTVFTSRVHVLRKIISRIEFVPEE